MKPISTLTVNGETFVICDPNGITRQQLEETLAAAKAETVEAVIAALPVYQGEVV